MQRPRGDSGAVAGKSIYATVRRGQRRTGLVKLVVKPSEQGASLSQICKVG
jgi:hypothetical protein